MLRRPENNTSICLLAPSNIFQKKGGVGLVGICALNQRNTVYMNLCLHLINCLWLKVGHLVHTIDTQESCTGSISNYLTSILQRHLSTSDDIYSWPFSSHNCHKGTVLAVFTTTLTSLPQCHIYPQGMTSKYGLEDRLLIDTFGGLSNRLSTG